MLCDQETSALPKDYKRLPAFLIYEISTAKCFHSHRRECLQKKNPRNQRPHYATEESCNTLEQIQEIRSTSKQPDLLKLFFKRKADKISQHFLACYAHDYIALMFKQQVLTFFPLAVMVKGQNSVGDHVCSRYQVAG